MSIRSDSTLQQERTGADRLVLAALCAASFLASLNFFAFAPFFPPMARDLHTTIPLLGQMSTLLGLISAGLGLVIGPWADRRGYRPSLVLGTLAIAINLAGTALAPSYAVILALSLVAGLGDALVFGVALAAAGTQFTGDARRRAIAWTTGSLGSAPVVGVPILTTIGGSVGWRAALLIAGLCAVGVAGLIVFAIPPAAPRPVSRFRMGELLAAYAPLLRHAPTLRLLAASLLRSIPWLGLTIYLGSFLGDDLRLSTRQIGLVYTASGLGYGVGSLAAGSWLRQIPPRATVAICCVLTWLGIAAMTLLAVFWQVPPLQLALSSLSSIIGVSISALLVAESPAGTGTTMVLNGSIVNLGATGGAALGGVLIAAGGYDALLLVLPILLLVAAALAWWPSPRHQAAES